MEWKLLPSDIYHKYTHCEFPVVSDIILKYYYGQTIKINGLCYEFSEYTEDDPTNIHSDVDETFDTCLDCINSPAPFTFTVNTSLVDADSTPDTQFQLPLLAIGEYNMVVDWGDGNTDWITSYQDTSRTHTYDASGEYTIQIHGLLRGWGFPGAPADPSTRLSNDPLKITEISQWGCLQVTEENQAFRDCINAQFTATDKPDFSQTTDLYQFFRDCDSIVTVEGLTDWDYSGITSLHSMFRGCALFNQSIGGMDVSNVESFRDMIAVCPEFNNGGSDDIQNWDLSSAVDMHATLGFSGSFNQPLAGWDVSNVLYLDWLFAITSSFNQDISGWDVRNCLDMNNMFWSAASFKQDIGDWKPISCTNFTNFGRGSFDINDPNSATNQDNYDSLLIGWAAEPVQPNQNFNANNCKYSAAAQSARDYLTGTLGWTISDGGLA